MTTTDNYLSRLIMQLPKLVQRQDGTLDQLRDLIPIAYRLGLHDAAEWLKVRLAELETRTEPVIEWIQRAPAVHQARHGQYTAEVQNAETICFWTVWQQGAKPDVAHGNTPTEREARAAAEAAMRKAGGQP